MSYASLRALAATFDMDFDLLERELYAMKQSTDDFVEIPSKLHMAARMPHSLESEIAGFWINVVR